VGEILFRFKHRAGHYISMESLVTPIVSENDEVKHILIASRNVDQRLQYEKAKEESDLKYRLIAENTSDLIRIVDADGMVSYTSPSHERLLGYRPAELEGKHYKYHTHPEDLPSLMECWDRATMGQPQCCSFRMKTKHNGYIWLESIATPVISQTSKSSPILNTQKKLSHLVSVTRVITDRKQHEEELKQLAYHDSLTGVPNRRLFYDRLTQSIRKANRNKTKFAVLYLDLDLDRFKWVNDTFGHEAGDLLLKGGVERIYECLRETDTLARLGGDEFAIIIDDIKMTNEVTRIAQDIVQELQNPLNINGNEFITTSSIGIGIFPDAGMDMDTLLSNADQALYQSKEKGRNMYHFWAPSAEDTKA
jgi:diguanylate cyclase (GGDEF)-like protein/PAS domain S-box-containing protein